MRIMTYGSKGLPLCTVDLCKAIEDSGCIDTTEEPEDNYITGYTLEGMELVITMKDGSVHRVELPICKWVDECLAAKPSC